MAEKVIQKVESGTTNRVQKISPQTLPAAYSSLGVTRGYNPVPSKDLRMFIVGPSGEGKTTFVSGTPRTLVLDFERGASGIPGAKAHRLHIPTAEALNKIIAVLVRDAQSPTKPFDRIVFDTIDEMAEVMNPALAARQREVSRFTGTDITDFGTKGAGWAILKAGCWSKVQELELAGYTWTIVGHITEKTITVNNKDRTVTRPVIFDSFSRLIGRNCEVFAAIYSLMEEIEVTRDYNGRKVGGIKQAVNRVYMDATTINSEKNTGQGKLRGVPTMTTKILLPEPLSGAYGWDAFTREYDDAVTKIKEKLEKGMSPVGG